MKCCLLVGLVALGTTPLPLPAEQPAPEPVAVKFELLLTNHMVIKVKLNGKGPYRFIFDTGSPITLVNTRTAKAAGLIDKQPAKSAFSLFGLGTQLSTIKVKELEIGKLKAESVPVIVMDHPTVEFIAEQFGPVEGIIGFPFFARYRMTLDYQNRELTFVPTGFVPGDVLQKLMATLMTQENPPPKILAPAALWGLAVEKEKGDEEPGITIKKVLPGSAAAKAGLMAGDRLLILDDRWTDSVADCFVATGYVKAGTEVKVRIKRDGQEKELTVTPQAGL